MRFSRIEAGAEIPAKAVMSDTREEIVVGVKAAVVEVSVGVAGDPSSAGTVGMVKMKIPLTHTQASPY